MWSEEGKSAVFNPLHTCAEIDTPMQKVMQESSLGEQVFEKAMITRPRDTLAHDNSPSVLFKSKYQHIFQPLPRKKQHWCL